MRDANIEDPDGKNIDEVTHVHLNTYKILGPPPESLEDKPAAASQNISPDAEAEAQKPAKAPPTSKPQSNESLIERIQRFAENPTMFYATIGVGLGVLIGVIFAIVSLLTSNPVGRNDMGPVTSDATGLKGHLYIKWEKALHYRVTFETSDPDEQAGFVLAVANPPRPLSIVILLQDDEGAVLCSREIVLKNYARSAAATTANHPNEPPAAIDSAQLEAQEQEREQGRDVFENQIGPDGKVDAINAQGVFPCSMKDYEKTSQWSFSTDFPSLDEQDELLEGQQERRSNAARRAGAHKKPAVKGAERPLPFTIEGDDMIVDFDLKRGVIVTSGRNTFFLDKTSLGSANPAWQEYPVEIHFRCDRYSNCTLMHAGAGDLHVKLKR